MAIPTPEKAKWTLEKVRGLSAEAFEELVASLFQEMGFEYEMPTPTRSADWGVDGIAYRVDELGKTHIYYIQCKRYAQQKVGAAEIREFRGTLSRPVSSVVRTASFAESQEPEAGYFVTSSGFTKPALEETRGGRALVFTIDGRELVAGLNRHRVPMRAPGRALRVDKPRGIYGFDDLSAYYIDVGKPHKALKQCEEDVERNPLDVRAWSQLGNVYRKLGKVSKAIVCWDRALEPALELRRELQSELRVTLDKITVNLESEASVARAYALIENTNPALWIVPARERSVYEEWFDDAYEAISSEDVLTLSKEQVGLGSSVLAVATHLAVPEEIAAAMERCIHEFAEGRATSYRPTHFAPVIFHLAQYDILAKPSILPLRVLVSSLQELGANAPDSAQASTDLVRCASEVVLGGKADFGKLHDHLEVRDYCRQLQQMGIVGSISRAYYHDVKS